MSDANKDRELEAAFHLVAIPELFGHEIDHKVTSSGVTFTTVLIRECEDLTLTRSLKVEFEIPAGYPSADAGPIHVFPDNIESFTSSEVIQRCPEIIKSAMGRQELCFPWMADTKYPISVWFYTVRNLLKNSSSGSSSLAPWSTPLLQRKFFPHKRRYHRSKPTAQNSRVQIVTGAGRTRGKRPYMEDTDFSFASTRLSDVYPSIQVIGVLDGHGGAECALFVQDELPGVISSIARREGGTSSMSRGASVSSKPSAAALPEILHKAYLQVDKEFLRTTSHTSGSTACIMLRDAESGRAYIGNTGDTRAVLCRAGKAVDVTIDRKATDPDEIARVAAAGGHVTKGRVMGSLAVARAIGDTQLKKGRNLKHGSWQSGTEALIVDPEITSFRPARTGDSRTDDEFLIIATDGLWDVMSSQQAVDSVQKSLSTLPYTTGGEDLLVRETDLNRIADGMASQALDMGSMDNITVMLVHFSGYDMSSSNSDDEDGGYISDDVTLQSASQPRPALKEQGRDFSRPNAKDAFNDDISSLLENVPNKFSASAKALSQQSFAKTPSSAPFPKPSSQAKRSSAHDDLDMDFLLDDSNF